MEWRITVKKSHFLKASFTIEAGIVGVFLLVFLGMAIQYEIKIMNEMLDQTKAERTIQQQWRLGQEIERYFQYRELEEILKQRTGG